MNKTSTNVLPEDFNKLGSTLEQIQDEAFKDLNSKKINTADTQYYFKIVLKGLMFKASCVCKAVLAVLKHNPTLYCEAEASSRFLSELLIHVKYILKNPEKFSERFLRFNAVVGYMYLEKRGKQSLRLKQKYDSDARTQDLKKQYYDFKADYKIERERQLWSWSGKSLRAMAKDKEVNEQWLHGQVYWKQCSSVHVGSSSLLSCIHKHGDDYIIKRQYNPQEIERIIVTCISLFGQLYGICDEVFNLKKKAWIENIGVKLAALNDKDKIEYIITEGKCPYCNELTIKKFDEYKIIQLAMDKGLEKIIYYTFGCKNEDCVPKFYIEKNIYDELKLD